MEEIAIVGLLAATVRFATPILLAALGEAVSERAGTLNIGIEGIMLVGAFLSAWAAVATGSPWAGLGLAIAGGMALAACHAVLTVTCRVDQIVSGIALIIFGLGLSSYGYRISLGKAFPAPSIPLFEKIDFGALAAIPGLGAVLFSHHLLVYATFAMVLAVAWFLYRTTWGLEIRAIGENPAAAEAVGIGVARVRYGACIFGGALAGGAGAFLVLAHVGFFVENMVAGRGFIAVVCVVFGRWNPAGVLLAALLFGFADALQIRLQSIYYEVPHQFFIVLPHALAIASLVVFAGRTRFPSALGVPFYGSAARRRGDG